MNPRRPVWPELVWRAPEAGAGTSETGPRVLGINPWIYDVAAYNFWLRPTGLLACLEALRLSGASVGLLDCLDPLWSELPNGAKPWSGARQWGLGPFPKTPLPKPLALRQIPRNYARYGQDYALVEGALARLDPAPDLILITCLMTYWSPGAAAAIELVRKRFPRVPLALGGVYATLCREHARALAEELGVDLVLSGALETPENWDALWRLLKQPLPPRIPDTAGFALGLEFYPEPEYGAALGSRGCPFACAYCASRQLYPRFRQRAFPDIWAELKGQYQRGARNFAFFDDALLVAPETWLLPTLQALTRLDAPVALHTPNAMHARYLTQEICVLLRKAGLKTIRLGLESASFSDRLDAKLNAEEWEAGLAALLGAGFKPEEIGVYLLFGLPDQDYRELAESVAAVRARGLQVHFTHFSPLPGAPLFERAVAAAAQNGYDLINEPLTQNNSLWPCKPGGFSWAEQAFWKRLAHS